MKTMINAAFLLCLLMTILFFKIARSQSPETHTRPLEDQLENRASAGDDIETEDDSYALKLEQYIKDPVNLNTAGEAALNELEIIGPLQVQSLLSYRKIFGKLLSIYELQAVPGWDIGLIRKIRPFITVSNAVDPVSEFKDWLHKGQRNILFRLSGTLEKQLGYMRDTVSQIKDYPGSAQRIMLRYRYHYRNLLSYGFLAEKDPGESFFKGKQKQGFDFYSAHFFVRTAGFIKAIALGDYTVNLGQGLIHWQGLAFGKGAEAVNIARNAEILRPYTSSGETNFLRGGGIVMGKKNMQAAFFASLRNLDANLVQDSLLSTRYVTSLQTSGYHRTAGENADKGVNRQVMTGAVVKWKIHRLRLGLNASSIKFSLPLKKEPQPYNYFGPAGKSFRNLSADYGYTLKNFYFFGEAAMCENGAKALVNGLVAAASASADISVLYRNISRHYHALYGNAFTESATPVNEQGIYTGISIHPGSGLKLDAFADFFSFPWLRFNVDAPSSGQDYMLQLTYKPGKLYELYARYRSGNKLSNADDNDVAMTSIVPLKTRNFRLQFSCQVNAAVVARSRAEIMWYTGGNSAREQAFLIFTDFSFKPALKSWSGNARIQYFETGSYNSRLYAFENDVPSSYSIPAFYGKGCRYYVNLSWKPAKKLSAWFRFSRTVFRDRNLIGSNADQIRGSHRSDLRFELLYDF